MERRKHASAPRRVAVLRALALLVLVPGSCAAATTEENAHDGRGLALISVVVGLAIVVSLVGALLLRTRRGRSPAGHENLSSGTQPRGTTARSRVLLMPPLANAPARAAYRRQLSGEPSRQDTARYPLGSRLRGDDVPRNAQLWRLAPDGQQRPESPRLRRLEPEGSPIDDRAQLPLAAPLSATAPRKAHAPAVSEQPAPAPARDTRIMLTGRGDATVQLNKLVPGPAVVHITGNEAAHFFCVHTLSTQDELVTTLDPYDGVRALDWNGGESTGFEVRATGPWTISVLPLASVPSFDTVFRGENDSVVHFAGEGASADITGNEDGRYFSVRAFSAGQARALVNTTEPYSETAPISAGPHLFEVRAVGHWTIAVR
jgi:hypothetical protein